MDTIIKNSKLVELNTKILSVVLNIKTLNIIKQDANVYVAITITKYQINV